MNSPAEQPATIPAILAATVAAGGDRPALGTISGGELRWRTWREVGEAARRQALALRGLQVQPGDRVAQFAGNSEAWILADLAIQLAGAVHVPLHGSISPPQVAEQTAHAGAKLLLVENDVQAAQLGPLLKSESGGASIVTHAALSTLGDNSANAEMAPIPPARPDDLATILYTSGTTGAPLGVMLSQRNLVCNARAMSEHIASQPDEIRLGLLPLSHIYARTCDLYIWLLRGARFVLGESRDTFLRDCQIVRPTVLNCVPYVYQKVADGLRKHGDATSNRFSKKIGHVGDSLRESQSELLRNVLGGQVQRCYCGGAAMPPEVERFFAERGLPVMCGYGLSEASPVISMSDTETAEAGCVGRPLANLELRIAADGELFVRGESVMLGYWRNPEATALAIQDGWLATGDLAEWSTAGNLRIVGRKKELIVLATGKKATPTRIEQLLCGSPMIEQACVVGDGRKFLAALLVPAADAPRDEGAFRAEIDRCLGEAAHCEQMGAFSLLDEPFSIERGEMTPKQSLRRRVIEERYASAILRMYRGGGVSGWW